MAKSAGKPPKERPETEKTKRSSDNTLKRKLRLSEKLYRSLFENMINGFAYCQMIYQDSQPCDFIYLAVNEAFEKQTGLINVVGKRVSELFRAFNSLTRDCSKSTVE